MVVALAVSAALGLWRLATDGRFGAGRRGGGREPDVAAHAQDVRPSDAPAPGAELVSRLGGTLGERATLLQFSSAFCAPCRATRRVLAEVSGLVDGVAHVEVDAEQHLDATRAFAVLRTPTTVVLDARGVEVTRAAGAPTKAQVLSALAGANLT